MSGIPDWTTDRTWELYEMERKLRPHACPETVWQQALARYIAAHEEAPVDPLLVEAREVYAQVMDRVGSNGGAKNIRDGKREGDLELTVALAAIKRGIEIGEGK